MRGDDRQQGAIYSYIAPEARLPEDYPPRVMRVLVDLVRRESSPRFKRVYGHVGRPPRA